MKNFVAIAAALSAAILAGCNTPRVQSRDQWQAEAQRTYSNRTPEQVLRAAEAVLDSVNPGRLVYKHSASGFLAHIPFHTVGMNGVHIFEVKATKAPKGTLTVLAVSENGASRGSPYSAEIDFISTHRLFFSWLDYALGKSTNWVPCSQVEAKFGISGGNDAWGLCGPGAKPGGAIPVEPQPEWITQPRSIPSLHRQG